MLQKWNRWGASHGVSSLLPHVDSEVMRVFLEITLADVRYSLARCVVRAINYIGSCPNVGPLLRDVRTHGNVCATSCF
jgi:hypothetical protein